jgi:Na+/melibiose symporter-like transporter
MFYTRDIFWFSVNNSYKNKDTRQTKQRHKTKTNKIQTQQNVCCTPLYMQNSFFYIFYSFSYILRTYFISFVGDNPEEIQKQNEELRLCFVCLRLVSLFCLSSSCVFVLFVFVLCLCFVCLRLVFIVPNVSSFTGLSIFDCYFGIL